MTGIAWETGLLAGLAEAGIDLTSADLVVGTSAGSVVGAQILSGVSLEDLYAGQLVDAKGEIAASIGAGVLVRFIIAAAWPGDARKGRARLGHAALKARTVPESERREVIRRRLPKTSWPERALLITAVDAETGESRVFDRDSGVDLARRGCSQLRSPHRVARDHHRWAPLHRWWRSIDCQCRSCSGLLPCRCARAGECRAAAKRPYQQAARLTRSAREFNCHQPGR